MRNQHHQRHACFFSGRPEFVELAVGEQRLQQIGVKSQANAKHAWLLTPRRELFEGARRFGIKPAHDGEALRVRLRGGKRDIVAVALPARRHDDHAINAGGIHRREHFILAERHRPVRLIALGPGALVCRHPTNELAHRQSAWFGFPKKCRV